MIKAIIADDEPLARDELIFLLKQCDDIEIVGEAASGEEVLAQILAVQPDVVFLDIHMPNLDGLSVAHKLLEHNPKQIIVFATAYDQHAIKAFEVNAIDYLLKPFDEERVGKTVERIKQRLNDPNHDAATKLIYEMLGEKVANTKVRISKLAVQCEERVILIDPQKIVYVYRENREVFIKTTSKLYTTKYSLQTLEEKLADYPFFRTHRSYLVNLNFAQELVPWFNGAYTLIMSDEAGSQIPISRIYAKQLRDCLSL